MTKIRNSQVNSNHVTTGSDTHRIWNEKKNFNQQTVISMENFPGTSKTLHEDDYYDNTSTKVESYKLIGKDILSNTNFHRITVNTKVKSACYRKKNSNAPFDNRSQDYSKLLLFHEIFDEKNALTRKIQEFEKEVWNSRDKNLIINELDKEIKHVSREKLYLEKELNISRIKLLSAETELIREKSHVISLRSTITSLQQEIETYKAISSEQDKLRNENIYLHETLQKYRLLQDVYENRKSEIKQLQYLNKEGNILKNKSEGMKRLEDESNAVQLQDEDAELTEDQRRNLKMHVRELEACILEQENEIHRLVSHIDHLVNEKY